MRVAYAARVFSFFSVYSAQQRFSPWRHGTVVAPVFVDLNNPVSVQAQERNRVQRLCIIRDWTRTTQMATSPAYSTRSSPPFHAPG